MYRSCFLCDRTGPESEAPVHLSLWLPFSFSNHVGGLKWKGATNKKEPQKRGKVSRPEAPSEDLLVAMALSRSEMEQCPGVPQLRLENAFSEKRRLGAGICAESGESVCPVTELSQLLRATSDRLTSFRLQRRKVARRNPQCVPHRC